MTNEITQKLSVALAAQAPADATDQTSGKRFAHKARSPWQDAWRQFRRHRLAMVGALALLAIILSTLVGPLVYTTPYNKVDFVVASQGPSWDYPFGTNDLGQDLLARVLWGGRISVAVSVFAMLVAITLGTLIGSLAGFFGGALDQGLMRVTDLFLSLPQLPLLLLIIYLFRESVTKSFYPQAPYLLRLMIGYNHADPGQFQ